VTATNDFCNQSYLNVGQDTSQHNVPVKATITKVMVKLSMCLTKSHAINTYGWVEVRTHAFLTCH